MTTRFDVERAVCASELPPSERLVLFVLLQHADNDPVIIPVQFTPSLSGLASETGLDRRTVERVLGRLESQGWVRRQRPPVEESRKGVRTRYQVVVPLGAQDPYPDPQLGAQDPQARGVVPPGVGAPVRLPRGVVPPMSTQPLDATHSTQRAGAQSDGSRNGKPGTDWLDSAVDFVTERLTATTTRTYDRRDITGAVTAFMSGRSVRNPSAFIRKCATENVLQFEPTPTPPRYQPEGNP